ncbi:MAG: DUF5067 domain-containing protein [Coriobacteriales bacterium]|jgi:hypothetical protein|nr:DUF5067 domain-containing protein [Coriobacteriales bacterium]
MKKIILLSILASFLIGILALMGCSSSDERQTVDPDDGQVGETQVDDSTDDALPVADFTIVFGASEVLAGDGGSQVVKVEYEFINKGASAVPSEVSSVRATQDGVELSATTIGGETGSVDYLVRGGGSVQCSAIFTLDNSKPVTIEIINSSTGSTVVASTEVPVG